MSASKSVDSGDFFTAEPRNHFVRWVACLSVVALGLGLMAFLPVDAGSITDQRPSSVKPVISKTAVAQPAR
jgi:hypothetical protein